MAGGYTSLFLLLAVGFFATCTIYGWLFLSCILTGSFFFFFSDFCFVKSTCCTFEILFFVVATEGYGIFNVRIRLDAYRAHEGEGGGGG